MSQVRRGGNKLTKSCKNTLFNISVLDVHQAKEGRFDTASQIKVFLQVRQCVRVCLQVPGLNCLNSLIHLEIVIK